jgi:hypothetical protein
MGDETESTVNTSEPFMVDNLFSYHGFLLSFWDFGSDYQTLMDSPNQYIFAIKDNMLES